MTVGEREPWKHRDIHDLWLFTFEVGGERHDVPERPRGRQQVLDRQKKRKPDKASVDALDFSRYVDSYSPAPRAA